tara:strand:- start:14842 stop:15270 length:429 start_codon:yes stop_codon:yes gene_type:complete
MTIKFPFHLAIPSKNLQDSLDFYKRIFPIQIGRQANEWIDLNFYGHQLVLHLDNSHLKGSNIKNPVDGDSIPVPHFGIVLNIETFEEIKNNIIEKKIEFLLSPKIRFKNQPGEQHTMFVQDPSENVIEIKAFKSSADLFKIK